MPTWEKTEVRELVAEAQRGSHQAFEMLYKRYNGQISHYVSLMVGDESVGCELTQETFLKVWRSLPHLRSPSSFVGWLYRIAANVTRTYQKKYSGYWQNIPLDRCKQQGESVHIDGPERQVEQAILFRVALSQVSQTYRSCLILYVIEDLPQRQIAELVGINEKSVSKYISRGKQELRQLYLGLEESDVVSSRRGE